MITSEVGLDTADLEMMNIGDALDVVYSYIRLHDSKRSNTRKATQADIDRMF